MYKRFINEIPQIKMTENKETEKVENTETVAGVEETEELYDAQAGNEPDKMNEPELELYTPPSDYEINYKKITTVKDVVLLLKALDPTFPVSVNTCSEELKELIAKKYIKEVTK